jgi:hypothetical protein
LVSNRAYIDILNNPLSYTDPSGYFLNKLFKGINKVLGKFAPIVGIAIAIYTGFAVDFLLNVVGDAIAATLYAAGGGFFRGWSSLRWR